jgi:outer membrane protein OmpA-like peptidoglycan-associated protein
MRIGISQSEFNSKTIGKNTLIALAESREPIIVYFEFDSYSVRREYVPELMTLIQTVQFLEGIKIHIEGHTDNTGSSAYNLILSKRRALSVKNNCLRREWT